MFQPWSPWPRGLDFAAKRGQLCTWDPCHLAYTHNDKGSISIHQNPFQILHLLLKRALQHGALDISNGCKSIRCLWIKWGYCHGELTRTEEATAALPREWTLAAMATKIVASRPLSSLGEARRPYPLPLRRPLILCSKQIQVNGVDPCRQVLVRKEVGSRTHTTAIAGDQFSLIRLQWSGTLSQHAKHC